MLFITTPENNSTSFMVTSHVMLFGQTPNKQTSSSSCLFQTQTNLCYDWHHIFYQIVTIQKYTIFNIIKHLISPSIVIFSKHVADFHRPLRQNMLNTTSNDELIFSSINFYATLEISWRDQDL
jgi:ABC-type dipeptide/oligopeptide/nickel transport system permease component